VTADTARKLLVKKAGSKENSVGFFGWADDYLFRSPVDALNEPNAFLTQVARFTALMASGEAPESLAFFASAGSINALNKLSAKENDTHCGGQRSQGQTNLLRVHLWQVRCQAAHRDPLEP
jgi:hypothetical protein